VTTIKDAVDDLFNNPELPPADAVDRHYGPGFRQRTNGDWDERSGLLARVVEGREVIERATITVLDELIDGTRYAERHVVDLAQTNGGRIRQEVYVFAEQDSDGRFVRIEEMTLLLEGPYD
jgi:hypothetical protein